MKVTAFVSHEDCARHDTGWNHPDHQGRLPAIARAVYRDMLTLFEPLLEVGGVPATREDLQLVHDAAYLSALSGTAARAAREGSILALDGVPVSGATWDAVLTGAGSAITAAETVLAGEVRNAFAMVRPPGRDAEPSRGSGASLVNHVAIVARHLVERRGLERVVVLSWGARPPTALGACLDGEARIAVVGVHQASEGEAGARRSPGVVASVGVAAGGGADVFAGAMMEALKSAGACDLLILSAGFDILADDPTSDLAIAADEVHGLTAALLGWAEASAGGRIVSVLDGGYAAAPTARAVVQHLRALARLDQA